MFFKNAPFSFDSTFSNHNFLKAHPNNTFSKALFKIALLLCKITMPNVLLVTRIAICML
jgi:hypothetical protein